MKLRLRYTMTTLFAAVLLLGLPLAWVRRELDRRHAYLQQIEGLAARNVSLMVDFEGSSNHRWLGFFEGRVNVNSVVGISAGGGRFGNDDLRVLDGLPNLRHVRLWETAVTDEGLMHLASQHPNLERVDLWSFKVTEDGIAQFKRDRPSVQLVFDFVPQLP